MQTLGIYIFNAGRNQWLQGDGKTWGGFNDAIEFADGDEDEAEELRTLVSGTETTFTMAGLQ